MTLTFKYDRPNVHYCFIGTGPSLPEEMRASSGQKCPEINIDYIGNSLNNKINKKETWQECGKWCRDTPGCNYWTWTPPGSAYPKWCFLKTARASNVNFFYKAVSGAKGCTEFSTDYNPKVWPL